MSVVIWLLCAIGGGLIYQSKNRPFGKGFCWGLFLGLIGVIVTLCKSRKPKQSDNGEYPSTSTQQEHYPQQTQNLQPPPIPNKWEEPSDIEKKEAKIGWAVAISIIVVFIGAFTYFSLNDENINSATTSDTLNLNALNARNYKEFDILLSLGEDGNGNNIEWTEDQGGKGRFGIDKDNRIYYIKTPTYFNSIKYSRVSDQGVDQDDRKVWFSTDLRYRSVMLMVLYRDNTGGCSFELPIEVLQHLQQ